VVANAYACTWAQVIDHVIAPRIPGHVAGGWNEPHPTPWARQVSAGAITDGATAPPVAARLEAASPSATWSGRVVVNRGPVARNCIASSGPICILVCE
jgi:hypothetical protein